jgi:prolyl 4-hydroxylase
MVNSCAKNLKLLMKPPQTGKDNIMHVDRKTSGADAVAARVRAMAGIRATPSKLLTQFFLPGFLDPALCETLIALIDRDLRPSTLADAGDDDAFRTSMTCDLNHAEAPVVALDAKLCSFMGIDRVYGEPLQGQRYDVGQEFKYHTDYFEPNGYDYAQHCRVPGQRTWTAMIYLNVPGSGGGTRFKATGKIFQPETGKLLLWDNLNDAGSINPNTIHHGMKVRAGRKYVITKWFRERPWPWPADAHG